MKNKSKIRERISIVDWSICVWYVNPRNEYLEELDREMVTLINQDLPKEITEQIESFLLNEYEPKMVGKKQNKWK
jgi:peroxiredoxin